MSTPVPLQRHYATSALIFWLSIKENKLKNVL